MYSWFHTGGGNNSMEYSNSTVDSALEDARVQSDQAKRTTDYQDAEKQILDDSSYVFINHGVAVQATTTKEITSCCCPRLSCSSRRCGSRRIIVTMEMTNLEAALNLSQRGLEGWGQELALAR